MRNVEKSVFILVLFIDAAHKSSRRGQNFVDKDENGLFRSKLDTFANDIAELADRQVRRNKILLLVYGRNIGFFHLFADYLASQRLRKTGPEGHTGILSEYFCLMRSASALRFSKVCSSLNLERMLVVGESGSWMICQSHHV